MTPVELEMKLKVTQDMKRTIVEKIATLSVEIMQLEATYRLIDVKEQEIRNS